MNNYFRKQGILLLASAGFLTANANKNPNIIFILADDLGYGDVSCLNPDSKIKTPNIDRIAEQGIRFTDAHSSSAVCTPTRYGILTGRYSWRSTLKQGVLNGYSEPLIPSARTTMASMLKQQGYHTACIGKWHLGWNWQLTGANPEDVDFSRPIKNGPSALGFDYFFGISASLDMPPYVYVENDRVTGLPDRLTEGNNIRYGEKGYDGSMWRKGPTGSDFRHNDCLPVLTDRAVKFIHEQTASGKPFFLYLALPAPHTPILPSEAFSGKSGLNPYGDFVQMVDAKVGQILDAVQEGGDRDNTLIVFTSDNGCAPWADYETLLQKGHNPSYIYRGTKADLYDGGHRIPCLLQWPGKIKKAFTVSQTICLTDFMRTFAEISGYAVHDNEAEDSFSLLPALLKPGNGKTIREATVHHSINGNFSIRKGDWKLLFSAGSGGWSHPTPGKEEEGLPPVQLFNLENDPSEKVNVQDQFPKVVSELKSLMKKYLEEGRSTAGKAQQNDGTYPWKQLEGILSVDAWSREYHVSVNGNDQQEGSDAKPFRTINHAAQLAQPGNVITVHAGTYRERIDPARGGESDDRRIVYQAAPGENVEIKGSEVVSGWIREKSGIWKITLPNSFFGDYNPYKDSINGDWFNPHGRIHHTGEVFLNGKSLYEKETLEKVIHPFPNEKIQDKEGSVYTWYCESDDRNTNLWANFQAFDPNKELVEISVRPTCFYPSKPGVNYLTIRGFRFSQAATQWGAPTAEQVGMLATHWCKGWIIENNVISDSKCSGITLGKERGTGHNVWTADRENINRDGNIHYIEVLFRTLRNGWNKQNVGSHIVRNNTIFNCEQTGMCGSMGAAFSTIENNHIYNIYTKRQFSGAEIGGIKFHAAVDAVIRKNRIHHTGRGIWLDWMTQGTRVSGNLIYGNDMEDIFLEVNHGPFLIDNNILLSPVCIRTQSQGGAYVHNLIAGAVYTWPEPNRFTPYFLPHSTDIAALTTITGGDDRYYNNIFVGHGGDLPLDTVVIANPWDPKNKYKFGLAGYNQAKLPVWMSGNVFYYGAIPSKKDENMLAELKFNPGIRLIEKGEKVFLQMAISQGISELKTQRITSTLLGKARIPKARFENPDGSDLVINLDYSGKKRPEKNPSPGPFELTETGVQELKVW